MLPGFEFNVVVVLLVQQLGYVQHLYYLGFLYHPWIDNCHTISHLAPFLLSLPISLSIVLALAVSYNNSTQLLLKELT